MGFRKVVRSAGIAIIVTVFGTIIAACSSDSAGASAHAYVLEDSFHEIHMSLSNGRTVTCIAAASGNGYAVSCDWVNAR